IFDSDYVSFDTAGGNYHFEVDPFSPGGMLDASLALYDVNGLMLMSSATASLSESFDMLLDPGHYELQVYSAANVDGDIGQYAVGAYVPEPGGVTIAALGAILLRRRRSAVLRG